MEVWSNEKLTPVSEEQVRDYLSKLDTQKSNEIVPKVLRELANAIVRLLMSIYEKSW